MKASLEIAATCSKIQLESMQERCVLTISTLTQGQGLPNWLTRQDSHGAASIARLVQHPSQIKSEASTLSTTLSAVTAPVSSATAPLVYTFKSNRIPPAAVSQPPSGVSSANNALTNTASSTSSAALPAGTTASVSAASPLPVAAADHSASSGATTVTRPSLNYWTAVDPASLSRFSTYA